MNNLIKSVFVSLAFTTLSIGAVAQTDSTVAAPVETPVVDPNAAPVDPNAAPVDPNAVPSDASATPVLTDSTGAPISTETAPASTAAGEKPATRHKLYSGKHRGNNIIYDPKK